MEKVKNALLCPLGLIQNSQTFHATAKIYGKEMKREKSFKQLVLESFQSLSLSRSLSKIQSDNIHEIPKDR